MENNDRKYVVYEHVSPKNKRYFGITSMNVKRRWSNGHGYKHNQYFYRAIQKYGWNNFKHHVLFENLSESDAKEREKRLIAKYNTINPKFGYNITAGGEGANGLHHSEETKRILHEKNSGKNHPWTGKHHTEESKRKMSKALKGKYVGEKSWHYGKKKSLESRMKMSASKKGKPILKNRGREISQETREKLSHSQPNSKTVMQFELGGKLIIKFHSIGEASRKTKVSETSISRACLGKAYQAGGYLWMFEKDFSDVKLQEKIELFENKSTYKIQRIPVIQLDLTGIFVAKFNSFAEAERNTGACSTHISDVCKGKTKTAGGFKWMYAFEYEKEETA